MVNRYSKLVEDYTLQTFNYSRETISKRIKSAEVFGEENVEALRHLGTQNVLSINVFKQQKLLEEILSARVQLGHGKMRNLATMPKEQRNYVIENGVETESGNKTINEATTRELEEYKKQLKQRDEEKSQLQSQLEQSQRSESIAHKQLEK